MIPAKIRIGRTEWKTALWPMDGRAMHHPFGLKLINEKVSTTGA